MLITAIISAVSAALSAFAAIMALRIASKSTKATEAAATATDRQAIATDSAAEASRNAASAAQDSALTAETLTRIETARRHDELAPRPEVDWHFDEENDNIYLVVTPRGPLNYSIAGEIRWTSNLSLSPRDLMPQIAQSNMLCSIRISDFFNGPWPVAVLLQFNPAEGTPCPCPIPQPAEQGHWSRYIAVPGFD